MQKNLKSLFLHKNYSSKTASKIRSVQISRFKDEPTAPLGANSNNLFHKINTSFFDIHDDLSSVV